MHTMGPPDAFSAAGCSWAETPARRDGDVNRVARAALGALPPLGPGGGARLGGSAGCG
jgi:hypothetical protein